MDIRKMDLDDTEHGEKEVKKESIVRPEKIEAMKETDIPVKKENTENTEKKDFSQSDKSFLITREESEREIDLVAVVTCMKEKRKKYLYLLLAMITLGIFIAMIWVGVEHFFFRNSYVRGLISFNYEGIESGLDPNGAAFDPFMLKSPAVLEPALDSIGKSANYLSALRDNLDIQAVQPADVVERITVIKQMAESDPSNYEKLLDVNYYPSQYVVYLYYDGTFTQKEMTSLLNAVFESYREYFFATYADSSVVSVMTNLLNSDDYDYSATMELMETQIDVMQSYIKSKKEEAPEFRSTSTGMSFEDIASSLDFIESVDIARINSYIQNRSLTKNRNQLIEYYQYLIDHTEDELGEEKLKLQNVTEALEGYEKDPVIVVGGQEQAVELTGKNEYYDTLIANKLEISANIANLNTKLNRYITMRDDCYNLGENPTSKEFEYADKAISELKEKILEMIGIIESTTAEYYDTSKYVDAFQVVVPAQYKAGGGIWSILKKIGTVSGGLVLLVILIWAFDGFSTEAKKSSQKNKQ